MAEKNEATEIDGEHTSDSIASPVRSRRIKRAELYFEEDLANQRKWYSTRASSNKSWAQRFSLIVIGCGALVTFFQIFEPSIWMSATTGILGVCIALAQGAQRIWKFDETWVAYRTASEKMKRERRLYVNGAGQYAPVANEDEAHRLFVESIEQIIAEEQQVYWEGRGKPAEGQEAPEPPAS